MKILKIAPQHVLRRVVELPLAAERNLHAVLGFEMDRYTPFKAERVYYCHTVLSRDRERGKLRVALAIVPRDKADPEIDRLRALGIEPEALELGDVRIDLRPAGRERLWQLGALGGLAVALLAAAVALPIVLKAQALSRLEEEAQRVRREAAHAEGARRRLEAALALERELVARRQVRPAALEVVSELTRLLPDATWLSHLELTGSRLRIRGESANAAELVALLEGSAVLGGAAFDGALMRDPAAERERFTITATAHAREAK